MLLRKDSVRGLWFPLVSNVAGGETKPLFEALLQTAHCLQARNDHMHFENAKLSFTA